MPVEATFTIDRSAFPLGGVFEQLSGATVELDRVVPTSEALIPYFWIYADDVEGFTPDLGADDGVEGVRVIDEVEGQLFVRIDWNLAHESVLTAIVDTEVTLLSGVGDADGWTFEVRADERRQVSEFQAYCRERGILIELTQLHALSPLEPDREYDLTEGQREVLELAHARGYFDSPRGATQDDLAAALGITRQAVSSRLQRGVRRLVAGTLGPGGDPGTV